MRTIGADAERLVRAALDLIHEVAELKVGDRRLSARVDIATGLVIVGDLIGEGVLPEEAVVGETPNLAARLQAPADPGCIAISSAGCSKSAGCSGFPPVSCRC